MSLTKEDERFAALIGAGRVDEAKEQEAAGYKPQVSALSKGLALACENGKVDGIRAALGYYHDDHEGGKRYYQMYSKSYWFSSRTSGSSTWVFDGESAWKALIRSNLQPGDPTFDACSAALAEVGYGLGSLMRVTEGGDAPRLINECAARGWLGFAKTMQSAPGRAMTVNPAKGDSPIEWALASGRGAFAAWLVSKGAEGDDQSIVRAARGITSPFPAPEGASAPLDWEDQVLSLRIGAKLSGLQGAMATEWPKTMSEPLESPGRLMCWLMINAALAQASAAPKEGGFGRVERRAREIAQESGEDWDKLTAKSEGKGLAAFSKKTRATALALIEEIQAKANREIAAMESRQPPIAAALAHVDAGRLELAGKAFAESPSESKLSSCVAMLGLAKAGYWDMPMPRGDGEALQDRHPLRWAGFKLSLMACGRGLDGPIPGLSGTTLAGLCAALGFEDALTELIDAGAALDPDEMSQGPSPLELALRNGRARFAQVLIDSGASPLEGVKESPFGYPSKTWAIHMALDQREERLIESMLAADPRCAKLPDSAGKNLLERSVQLSSSSVEADAALGAKIASLAEKALLADVSRTPTAGRSRAL